MTTRHFKPGFVPTLVTLILLPILIRLGFWQIDRADEKQQIQQLFEQRAQLEAYALQGTVGNPEEIKYRRTVVSGTYDFQHEILLDNKVQDQVVGYHVLTPLKIRHSEKVVLVNRGWIAGGLDRRILPKFETPREEVKINGVISIPSSKVFTLSEYNRAGEGWPAVYQWIDFKDISKAIGREILPVIILLDPQDEHGFVRKWSKVNLKPEKNISYAVQWFTLALALVVIYIVVNIKKMDVSTNE